MAEDKNAGRVLLGRITGAQGLRGEVKIIAYTGAPEDIAAYGPLSTEDGIAQQFEIASLRPAKGGSVVASLKGVCSREAAEALRGMRLYVARDRLPKPGDGEFYITDLIGLKAIGPAGEAIGEVAAVHNFGAGDILEIRLAGSRKTEMIPFTEVCVPAVNLDERTIAIVMVE